MRGGSVFGDVRGSASFLGLCLVISPSTSYSISVRPGVAAVFSTKGRSSSG